MDQTFLAIISLFTAGYAFTTKQARSGLGFLVYTAAFILLIPGLSSGVMNDIFRAFAMVLFVVGSFLIIWKVKKVEVAEDNVPAKENEKTK
ncbi:MAG: hypothetical protein ABSE91_02300 [Patescibacteria group bacterium]|jgi:Na+/melibiose symporter-like transporter